MKRKDIFYKTKINVTILSTSVVLFCLFIFSVIFQKMYVSNAFAKIDNEILKQEKSIGVELRKKDFPIKKPFLKNDRFINNHPLNPRMVVVVYEDNKPIMLTQNLYGQDLINIDLKANKKIVDIKSNGYNFRAMRLDYNNYSVNIFMNVDSELQSIKSVKTALYISLVILLVIAIVLSLVLANKIIKPVKNAYDKQVYFVQDSSHEMRTPLAIMKGKLELLAKSIGSKNDDDFEHICILMEEIRTLEKLNKDLLVLSKEDIDFSVNPKSYKLNNFIKNIGDFYEDLAEIQDKNFIFTNITEDIDVVWDYEKIKRCIIILLENAFKYTDTNGTIRLLVENKNKNIIIKVSDNGIGIKENDKNRIFDRFFRSDDVRAQDISGSGIGLSLLKSMSNTLGFKIKLKSKYNIGSEFTLIIPKIIN